MGKKSPKVNPVVEAVASKLLECGLVEPKRHKRRKAHELSAIELAEQRLYRREQYKKRSKDPEYRERQRKAALDRYHNDPEYRERQRQASRERKRELSKDPEYRERKRQAERERRKDPEYVKRERQAKRERHRELSKDPEYRARAIQATREWQRSNPEKARANKARRRALKAGNVEPHPAEERWTVDPSHHTEAGECFWCGCALGDDVHVDHVIPISLGGREIPTNLVRSCPPCNLSKGAKHPDEWAAEIGWEDF